MTTNISEIVALRAEIDRLNAIIHTPHADDFWKAASIEAEFQRQTRAAEDGDKTPAAWFWLVGYLAGKALHAHAAGNAEKAEHHIITTAAALANWHRDVFGQTDMRPGIVQPAAASKPLVRCAAGRDGECSHTECPQIRDGEPVKSGRHCPLDVQEDES